MSAIWYVLDFPEDWDEPEQRGFVERCKKEKFIKSIFHPFCDRLKKYQGVWHLEQKCLFSHCIFLEGDNREKLEDFLQLHYLELRKETGKSVFMAVDETAMGVLQELCGKHASVGVSRGYIHQGNTYVTEGPLKGKERIIRKIDRHKRLARITIPIPGKNLADVALEIYAKD